MHTQQYIVAYDPKVYGKLEEGFEGELLLDDNIAEIVNDKSILDEEFFDEDDSDDFCKEIVEKCVNAKNEGKTVLFMQLEEFMSTGILEMLESINKANGGDALTFIFKSEED